MQRKLSRNVSAELCCAKINGAEINSAKMTIVKMSGVKWKALNERRQSVMVPKWTGVKKTFAKMYAAKMTWCQNDLAPK